jgi:lauroyl/myristoyl acyltransferase
VASRNLSVYLQHPLNSTLFRWYPPVVSRFYLRQLGRVYFSRFPEQRKRYVDPMKKTLRSSAKAADCYRHLEDTVIQGVLDHYFEKLLMAYWGLGRLRGFLTKQVKFVHTDLLRSALDEGRGVILTTAHFGAVEFLPASLALRDFPVTMVVKYKTAKLKRTLENIARILRVELVDAEEEGVMRKALSALRRGRIFITELDEFKHWKPSEEKVMNFMGKRVRLDRAVELIQRRTEAPVLMGLMERVSSRRYQLIFEQPEEHFPAPTGLGHDAQLLKKLEHYIYDYPAHWYNWKDLSHLEQLAH